MNVDPGRQQKQQQKLQPEPEQEAAGWPHLPQMRKESWSQFPQAWSYLVGNLRGSQLHVCLFVVVIQFPVLVTQSPLYIL